MLDAGKRTAPKNRKKPLYRSSSRFREEDVAKAPLPIPTYSPYKKNKYDPPGSPITEYDRLSTAFYDRYPLLAKHVKTKEDLARLHPTIRKRYLQIYRDYLEREKKRQAATARKVV